MNKLLTLPLVYIIHNIRTYRIQQLHQTLADCYLSHQLISVIVDQWRLLEELPCCNKMSMLLNPPRQYSIARSNLWRFFCSTKESVANNDSRVIEIKNKNLTLRYPSHPEIVNPPWYQLMCVLNSRV